jgi:hypothetical protein
MSRSLNLFVLVERGQNRRFKNRNLKFKEEYTYSAVVCHAEKHSHGRPYLSFTSRCCALLVFRSRRRRRGKELVSIVLARLHAVFSRD